MWTISRDGKSQALSEPGQPQTQQVIHPLTRLILISSAFHSVSFPSLSNPLKPLTTSHTVFVSPAVKSINLLGFIASNIYSTVLFGSSLKLCFPKYANVESRGAHNIYLHNLKFSGHSLAMQFAECNLESVLFCSVLVSYQAQRHASFRRGLLDCVPATEL